MCVCVCVFVCVCVCVCVIHVYIDELCGNMGSKVTRSLGKFNICFHGMEIRNRRIQSLCSSRSRYNLSRMGSLAN